MDDRNDAPAPGVTGNDSPARGVVPASDWPAADADTLTWARFYRERLGFVDLLPTPSETDRLRHARHLAAAFEEKWLDTHHGQAPPDALRAQWAADAEGLAAAVRGPVPLICAQHRDRPTTDADLVRWFTVRPGKDAAWTRHHPERGVCVRLGGSVDRLVQTDVDVGHARPPGDLGGELAQAPGLRATTPRGGVHVFTAGRGANASADTLAPGVEVRTSGWALLPSGAATPGRAWTDTAAGLAAPHPRLLAPTPRKPRPARPVGTTAPAVDGADGRPAPGRVATIILSEHGRGDGRTQAAGAIVGLLARPEGLPADAVDALAALLVERGAGLDWSTGRTRDEVLRWRTMLTRGPRDAEFAAEVLETWQAVRDVGTPPKGAAWARATAWSLWKTADRREEGGAGAEDLGHIGAVGDHHHVDTAPISSPGAVGECAAADVPITMPTDNSTAEVRASDYVLHGPYCTCGACKVAAPEVADAKAAERERTLRALLPSIAAAYPRESLRRDFDKTPARVEVLYPFADFISGALEQGEMGAPPVGHGYGREFGQAYGGITEGDFQAFGAGGAKGGKTFFIGQMADGLAMDTAARILGVPGYEARPLVMPVWVSEMPKEGEVWLRFISRHFGFDLSALSKGSMSVETPGVLHMAKEHGLAPARVVAQARGLADHYDDPRYGDLGYALERCEQAAAARREGRPWTDAVPGWAAHHVVREIDLSVLPRATGTGRGRVDPRSGPDLVGWVADAVALLRRDLAAQASVAEDQVLPLVILDPGQRFAGEGSSSKDALDALLGAVVSRICRRRSGLGAACIMSSDTTKAAARDLDLDAFLSASGQRLAADIFAGSQGIMHHCDVYAICGQDTGVPYRQTQWVRVLQSRTGAPAQCYPFSWETHLGRFRPRPAEALREARDDGGHGRGGARGKGGNRSWAPPGPVGDHDPPPGPRLPPYKQNGDRQHYGPRDD